MISETNRQTMIAETNRQTMILSDRRAAATMRGRGTARQTDQARPARRIRHLKTPFVPRDTRAKFQ